MNSLALAGIGVLAYVAGCVTCYLFAIDRFVKAWHRRRQATKEGKELDRQIHDFKIRAVGLFFNEGEKRILKDYPYILAVSEVPPAFLAEATAEPYTVFPSDCMGGPYVEERRFSTTGVRFAIKWIGLFGPSEGLILFLTLEQNKRLFEKRFSRFLMAESPENALLAARGRFFSRCDTN